MANTQFLACFLGFFLFLIVAVIISLIIAKHVVDGTPAEGKDHHVENRHKKERLLNSSYVRPVLKELSPEQIDEIHSRGMITPAECVKEWESADTCWIPSEGSATPWCNRYKNCHDCLVAMANRFDEYTSLFDCLKRYNLDI